jgi:hypothetical protein
MMRIFFSLSFVGIILFNTFILGQKKVTSENDKLTVSSGAISDLVLLYHGGTHRLNYTEEQLQPYIYRTTESDEHEWLFDGFLFLEFKDNLGYEYAKGYGQKPANKSQWTWLTKRNFEIGKGVNALNSSLKKLADKNLMPTRKRKVVLTLPDPIKGSNTWGDLNGKQLDFNITDDRIAACKWYVDHVIEQWNEQGFDQLQFKGFYWVAETQRDSWEILQELSKHIKSKGLDFYWIPYMYAEGAADWKKSGFDHAYQQPNYFFKVDRPYSLLTKAIDMGNKYHMGLEMEFDFKVAQPVFKKRFYDYIKAFENGGVWDAKPVAYYEGGGAWLEMSKGSASLKQMYNDLSDIVVKRQKRADREIKSIR